MLIIFISHSFNHSISSCCKFCSSFVSLSTILCQFASSHSRITLTAFSVSTCCLALNGIIFNKIATSSNLTCSFYNKGFNRKNQKSPNYSSLDILDFTSNCFLYFFFLHLVKQLPYSFSIIF